MQDYSYAPAVVSAVLLPPWEEYGSPTLCQDYLGFVCLDTPECSPLSLLCQLSAPL